MDIAQIIEYTFRKCKSTEEREISMTRLRIGKLANLSEVSVETIRYYERRGLLEAPSRSPSGYREYSKEAVKRLAFIRRGKRLGFSLEEIRELLNLQLTPNAGSGVVKGVVVEKIELIDKKIHELSLLKQTLRELSSLCDGQGPVEQCPILGFLTADGEDIDITVLEDLGKT